MANHDCAACACGTSGYELPPDDMSTTNGLVTTVVEALADAHRVQWLLHAGGISDAMRDEAARLSCRVVQGHGWLWQKTGAPQEITELVQGAAFTIPAGTPYQLQNDGSTPLALEVHRVFVTKEAQVATPVACGTPQVSSGAESATTQARPDPSVVGGGRWQTEFYFSEGCHIVEYWQSERDPLVTIVKARVRPNVTTQLHYLRGITERYVVLAGAGIFELGGEPLSITPGDVVMVPPGTTQRVTATSTTDLVFLCVCSPRTRTEAYHALLPPVLQGPAVGLPDTSSPR